MIDFHTHILPEMDDGSQSVEESVEMIESLKKQGVTEILATPHFYANRTNPERFLSKREASWNALQEALPSDCPKIRQGAEVYYFEGISRMEDLSALRIEGTDLLLLEMPFETWSSRVITEVLELAEWRGLRVVLAHIDRYLPYQKKKVWEPFLRAGLFMQMNTSFLLERGTRRKALKLLDNGIVQTLGTDCHGSVRRPPEMEEAVKIMEMRLGSRFVQNFFATSEELLYL